MDRSKKINSYSFPPMLGHINDVDEGTPEWAERLGLRIKLAVQHAERFGVDDVITEIKRALEAKIPPWKIWPIDNPCANAVRYFQYVSGTSIDTIDALMNASRDEETLRLWRKAVTRPKGINQYTKKDNDNIMIHSKQGTSRAYILDRLERERLDLYERVRKKELSANAAAKIAGWKKDPSPLKQLRNAWRKASQSERETFKQEIL